LKVIVLMATDAHSRMAGKKRKEVMVV
jgi:hypothetical protein